MKFGAVPIAEAAGTILAHSMTATGDAHYRVPKGTVLKAAHLRDLARGGHDTIVVAQLEHGDVEENEAATRLAHAIAPDAAALGLRISAAGAGRVNLYALHAGVCVLDEAAIHALNAVDPMITIATVAPFHRTDANSMIATIKIIAYGVAEIALQTAQTAARNAIRVQAPTFGSATLIETQVGTDSPSEKGRNALTGRLHRMGLVLSDRCVTAHSEQPLAQAIRDAVGEVIFVLTASATSDPLDVGPQALREAGGTVTGFGMPVDPGNLLFFGTLGDKPVIGLPGCARSPALNGADWVLERLICGLTLTQGDIAAMGVGGLLKEIPTRPQPRSTSVT
ncbi:molybdopterin-binding protein [Pseudosulfitobacter sp. SM2401]|uniref:molybdopterin-binding protein n=1 Tax=Pseudosulfitobacter sp. SM2401 TaxID=3350098 RepID=UPI0036F22061